MRNCFLICLVFFISCSGGGVYKDVQGVVKSTAPTTLNIPTSPSPTITVLGRSADEFQVEFLTAGSSAISSFTMKNVPQKHPVIFELTHTSLDSIISFPFDLTKTAQITLPAVPSGTITTIISLVETLSSQTVTATSGMILGQLNSEGGASGSCTPITSVGIKNKDTGISVSVLGPFYFNSGGNVVNSGHFSDSQCNYVMANVLPGVYTLEFYDNSLTKISEQEVVVLGGKVSFGMDVP